MSSTSVQGLADSRIQRRVEHLMGMPISLALRGRHATTVAGDQAWQATINQLRQVDVIFSTYRSDSIINRLDRGEPFAEAVRALPERLGVGMVAFADLIAGADRYGVPVGPVLESLAADVRATRRRLDEADARRLPVRLSFPLVICTLPSFVLLAIAPALIAALSSLSLDL